MRLPIIRGLIRRRLLVNFRADPLVVQKLLPGPFRPQLHAGYAIVGICLIRLEQVRPRGLPAWLGMSSENAAHRIAVEWDDERGNLQSGVFIPRRDTGSRLNVLLGGRVFPGEHHLARFQCQDANGHIEFSMQSNDGQVAVRLIGDETDEFPVESCFASLQESSDFFARGSLGYSSKRCGDCLDGLTLNAFEWSASPLAVRDVDSTYFGDRQLFPPGSIEFDHALLMRNISHEWLEAPPMELRTAPTENCRGVYAVR